VLQLEIAKGGEEEEGEEEDAATIYFGGALNESLVIFQIISLRGSELKITETQSKDSGVYTCNATNGLDYAQASAEVNVEGQSWFFTLHSYHKSRNLSRYFLRRTRPLRLKIWSG
jgi:hypothetical protein